MSIKTIKQRIALVAVSALTAGTFTVVSAPVANATQLAGASPYALASQLIIGTNADTDGTPDVPSSVQMSTLINTANAPRVNLTSVGWIADTNATSGAAGSTGTAGGSSVSTVGTSVTGGISRTGVVQAGAKISFAATSAVSVDPTSVGVSVVVTGGTIGSLASTSAAISLAGDSKSASVFNTIIAGVNTLAGTFTVTAAAGSVVTLAAYTGTGIINSDSRTSGTLIAIWSLTVAAANSSGTVVLGESTITQQPCIAYTAGSISATAFDTLSRCGNGRLGVVFVSLKDAFTAPVTTGQLAATATNGAFVNVVAGSSTATGDNYAATTAFDTTAASSNNYVLVTQPVANTGGSTVVTITYAGTVVGTKTINFAGDVATITILPASATVIANGVSTLTSGTSYGSNVVYQIRDAAGNAIAQTPTLTGATGAMLGATLSTSTETGVFLASSSASANTGYITINHPGGTATTNFGAGSYQIQALTAAGVAIKSNVYSVTVSSQTTNSFTASFDKASYSAGDFATLTISAKDINGNPMPTGKTLPGLVIAVTSGLTVAGAECTSASTFTAGSKTCSFAVGNTAGSYSWSVALTSATLQAPVTGVIKQADSAVSNAEVLKSIVALIASINKQIAALQKLILQRR
jgi:trimeric autotransporter adhesin